MVRRHRKLTGHKAFQELTDAVDEDVEVVAHGVPDEVVEDWADGPVADDGSVTSPDEGGDDSGGDEGSGDEDPLAQPPEAEGPVLAPEGCPEENIRVRPGGKDRI